MMYINIASTSHFISSSNVLFAREKSILLVCAIAFAILFITTLFWMYARFWDNYEVVQVQSKGSRSPPVLLNNELKKKSLSPLQSEKKEQKSLLSSLLDDAFSEIKNLQHELRQAKKDNVVLLTEKDEQQNFLEQEKIKVKEVEGEIADQLIEIQQIKEDNFRLKAEIDALHQLIGKKALPLVPVISDSPEEEILS